MFVKYTSHSSKSLWMRSIAEASWNASYMMRVICRGGDWRNKSLIEDNFRGRKKCHFDKLNLRLRPNFLSTKLRMSTGISHNQDNSNSFESWDRHRKLLLTYKDNSVWTSLNNSFSFLLNYLLTFKCNFFLFCQCFLLKKQWCILTAGFSTTECC